MVLIYGCGEYFSANETKNSISVSGIVVDQITDQPLDSVLIEITEPDQFQQSTISDSTGFYSFIVESEEPVNLTIEASKPDFQVLTQAIDAEPGIDITENLSMQNTNDDDGSGQGQEHDPKGAAAIILATEPPQAINIAETGNLVHTPLTFQVIDSAGNPLNTEKSVEVQFELAQSPGGEERLVPEKATTNGQGNVSTTLYGGNKAGNVKIRAFVPEEELGFPMRSSPVLIAIHGGFPDAEHFSLAREQKNVEAYVIDDVRVPISVILGDKFSNPVKPGTSVSFKTNGGIVQGSGTTDEDGKVEVELISGEPRTDDGRVTVTASTVNENDENIQRQIDVIFSTSEADINSDITDFDLGNNQSQNVTYTVTDLNGNPMAEGTQISVETEEDNIELSGDTDVTVGDFLEPGTEQTEFEFSLENTISEIGDISNAGVTITVTAPSGETTVYEEIEGTLRGRPEDAPPPGAAAIELSTPPADAINIAATGENVSTPITFQVKDSAGNALSTEKAAKVQFKLTSSPGGDEKLVPAQATTNDQGQVRTTLYSGNQAGVVQVQAVIQEVDLGLTIKSEPVAVSIHGGFPDENYFNMSTSTKNIVADATGLPTINVTLGDKFSNPVKPGTSVSFITSGGIIQGSAKTNQDGKASVNFVDLKPRPADGNVTVTASTVGENNQKIEQTVDLIFSTSAADISASPTDFELKSGESKTFSYTITDKDGNPMAEGTQIVVEGDEGIELSGDTDVTLDDHLTGGAGKTDFEFTAHDNSETEKEDINLQINVTSPSGETTTYNAISGTRIIEGNDRVGAAAIVLTEQPPGAININETGDDVSAPLTFQVRDSLGRPLTTENAVEVEFELVSSPGGGEKLVPETATTDGNGNVTTTLFSGNKAGEVKVQALVERPEVGLSIRSKPVLVAIHGGFPDENHFSIAPAKHNFEGFNINNNRNTITVVMGDKFSNPVKPGTVVYFETTGGIIQGSGQTDEDGILEVDLISGDPRPADGVATVTASTVNENDVRIQKTLDVVFSTSSALISATPETFNLPPNGGASFDYEVTDLNGNPMAAGTQISIDAGEGIEISGDANFTLGNNLIPGPGATEFSFSIRDTDDETNDEAELTLQITVTAPSGETTTYSGIQGIRHDSPKGNADGVIKH